jgi:hypothetical protein
MRVRDLLRASVGAQALGVLLAMAFGHVVALGIVVASVLWNADRLALQWTAGGLLAGFALVHLWRRRSVRARVGHAGLALWCFLASTAHGAGLVLVPALLPLCEALSSRA